MNFKAILTETFIGLNAIELLIELFFFFYFLTPGCIVALVAIVVSDLFGSRLLSDAYGLSPFARGPGDLLGTPLSGK